MSTQQVCIYCGRGQEPGEFSDEHIWSAKLGGNLMGGHFRSRRVCRQCNSKCGLFVDGALIRSFLHKNALAYESLRYANFDNGRRPILPPAYFGRSRNIDPSLFGDFTICEVWMSMCRSRVLHFHSRDSQKFQAQAGGNPMQQKKKPGVAIFVPASRSLRWLSTGLLSFREFFRRSTRYVAFMTLSDNDADIGLRPPEDMVRVLEQLKEKGALDMIDAELSFDIDAEDRFLSKVALGTGYMIFGDSYLANPHAKLHQQILNERDPLVRESLPSLSVAYANASEDSRIDALQRRLAWPGGILIAILTGPRGGTQLVTNVFSRMSITKISESQPAGGSPFYGGVVHILVPQLQRHIGPLPFMQFIGHLTGRPIPELAELESLRVDPGNLPSLNEISEEIHVEAKDSPI